MATTYDYIAANRRKSVFLIAAFFALIGLVGWVTSQLTDGGPVLIVVAAVFALISALGGYYGGDKIALSLSGAQGPITRENQAYLWNLVENLCLTTGTPMPKVYLISDPSINAFATGRDPKHASLAVTTGAIERLENEELEGVLAHELSHIRNLDIRFMTLVAVLVGFLVMLSDLFWRSQFFGGRRRSGRSEGQGQLVLMIIGIVALIFAPIAGQLIKLAASRRREFLADSSGALITRYPEGLARALEKIGSQDAQPMTRTSNATAHLFFSSPLGSAGRKLSGLFSTHPPIAERVAALRSMGSLGN